MDGNEPQLTKGGNPKPPSFELACEWIYDAWQGLSSDLVKKSFVNVGISKPDGSEDQSIVCFREIGMTNGTQLLSERMKSSRTTVVPCISVAESDYASESDVSIDLL